MSAFWSQLETVCICGDTKHLAFSVQSHSETPIASIKDGRILNPKQALMQNDIDIPAWFTLCWEGLEAGGEGDDKGWDG